MADLPQNVCSGISPHLLYTNGQSPSGNQLETFSKLRSAHEMASVSGEPEVRQGSSLPEWGCFFHPWYYNVLVGKMMSIRIYRDEFFVRKYRVMISINNPSLILAARSLDFGSNWACAIFSL